MRTSFLIFFLFLSATSICQIIPICVSPTINGTPNSSITLPNSSIIVSFTAKGNNGHPIISNYSIGQDSGITVTVAQPNQNVSNITGFTKAGLYKFHEIAIDSCGAKAVYYFYITVLPAVIPPPITKFIATATAGTVINGTCVLTCSANVSPFSVWWQKSSGGTIKYSNQASKTCTVSKLQKGTYVINLSADYQGTDPKYKGQNSQEKVTIVVK